MLPFWKQKIATIDVEGKSPNNSAGQTGHFALPVGLFTNH